MPRLESAQSKTWDSGLHIGETFVASTWSSCEDYSDIIVHFTGAGFKTSAPSRISIAVHYSHDGSTTLSSVSREALLKEGDAGGAVVFPMRGNYYRVSLSVTGADVATPITVTTTLRQNGTESNGASDSSGVTSVTVDGGDIPQSMFGEALIVNMSPIVQLDTALCQPEDYNFFTVGTTTAITYPNNQALLAGNVSGTGSVWVQSRRYCRYHTGQGMSGRVAALFENPYDGFNQWVGFVTPWEGLAFGYYGASNPGGFTGEQYAFGLARWTGGKPAYRNVEITATAAVSGTINVTVNGTLIAILVSNTMSTTEIAAAIVRGASAVPNISARQDGAVVTFYTDHYGFDDITFAFATATTVTVDSSSPTVAGIAPTVTFVAQDEWNIDRMNGTGPSGQILDPSKGNVYQIEYQWLGYGALLFSVENAATGAFQPVHRITYSNANTVPSLEAPSMRMGLCVDVTDLTNYNAALADPNIPDPAGPPAVRSASMAAFSQGLVARFNETRSASALLTSVDDNEYDLLVLKNTGFVTSRLAGTAQPNRHTCYLKRIWLGAEAGSNRTLIFRFYRNQPNAVLPTALANFSECMLVSSSVGDTTDFGRSAAPTASLLVSVQVCAANQSAVIELNELDYALAPEDSLLVTVEASAGSGAIAYITAVWLED